MQLIELKQIMALHGIGHTDLGRYLFPNHKEPYKAIRRILRGEMLLDSAQIAKLAKMMGVHAGALFIENPKIVSEQKGKIIFSVLGCMAELNTDEMITRVYIGEIDKPIKLQHEKGISLSEYTEKLKECIILNNK